jgi:hypothetical protein
VELGNAGFPALLVLPAVWARVLKPGVGVVGGGHQIQDVFVTPSAARVRREFSRLLCVLGSPAAAPKPSGRSPGRPKDRRSGPALRHPAIKKPTKKPRKKPPTTTKAA